MKNVIIKNDSIDGVNICDEKGRVIINLASEEIARDWLKTPYFAALYKLVDIVVTFSWDWEQVSDTQIVKYVEAHVSNFEDIDGLQDAYEYGGLPAARKHARKWAKDRGYSFINEPMDRMNLGAYMAAVLAAHRAENS